MTITAIGGTGPGPWAHISSALSQGGGTGNCVTSRCSTDEFSLGCGMAVFTNHGSILEVAGYVDRLNVSVSGYVAGIALGVVAGDGPLYQSVSALMAGITSILLTRGRALAAQVLIIDPALVTGSTGHCRIEDKSRIVQDIRVAVNSMAGIAIGLLGGDSGQDIGLGAIVTL